MDNSRPSCSKVISVDKYFFEINLIGDFSVSSIRSLQTKGFLGPFQVSMTKTFWEKS